MTKKIQISESDLYNIIKQVLLEQEEEENVWYTDEEDFNFRLFKAFGGDSEKFAKYHNKFYEKIVVDGDLYLEGTTIALLPNNFVVNGNFMLTDTEITSLPENLLVYGALSLEGTPIQSLPDNLIVGGSLNLEYTKIKSLPENLYVKGDLFLENTLIESLPSNLKVKGSIWIYDTPLSENHDLFFDYEEMYGFKFVLRSSHDDENIDIELEDADDDIDYGEVDGDWGVLE
jgi:hypothetical protein